MRWVQLLFPFMLEHPEQQEMFFAGKCYPATPFPDHWVTRGTGAHSDTWDRGEFGLVLARSKGDWRKTPGAEGWCQADKTYMRCPFHYEKTPSCVWVGERRFFHCFGCGKSGGLQELLDALPAEPYRERPPLPPCAEDDGRDIPF